MSVVCMAWVWKHSQSSGADRLVLLAIADIANDDGECTAYKRSVSSLAEKCRCSQSTVRAALRRLEEIGELTIEEGGGRKSNDYRIAMTTPPESGGVPESGAPNAGDQPAEDRRAPRQSSAGRLSVLDTSSSPLPRATRIADPFLLTTDMHAWAAEHVPSVDVRAETAKFVDHFRGSGARKVDWLATWRNWQRRAAETPRRSGGRPAAGAGTAAAIDEFRRRTGG